MEHGGACCSRHLLFHDFHPDHWMCYHIPCPQCCNLPIYMPQLQGRRRTWCLLAIWPGARRRRACEPWPPRLDQYCPCRSRLMPTLAAQRDGGESIEGGVEWMAEGREAVV